MKVRMRVGVSGTRSGEPWPGIGEVLEVDDAEGMQLCAGRLADPVAEEPAVEKAVEPLAEQRAEADDMDALYAKAEKLGVKVDGRWGETRLREEIAKAEAK